jgi:putative transposase
MPPVLSALLAFMAALFRSQTSLRLEHLALRHQLTMYQQGIHRPRLRPTDRLLWAWLSWLWPAWRDALVFVQPRSVIAWRRQRFLDHWRQLSQQGSPGRPTIATEARALIQAMWQANPMWGSPRIVGELRKVDIEVTKSTVEKYRRRSRKPPSPTWKTFLTNHVQDLVALDLLVVPTVRHTVLFVLVILAHHRRRVVHFNVTEHPTVERLIGSIRRDCLDHVIVLHEQHLRRLLISYFSYYHAWRTHRALDMDCPVPRPVQRPEAGSIREVPEVGGLHHHYERWAA